MLGFFRCAEAKLLFRFQVNFVCSYVLLSYTTFSRIFPSELHNIREKLKKPSPKCHKRPIYIKPLQLNRFNFDFTFTMI